MRFKNTQNGYIEETSLTFFVGIVVWCVLLFVQKDLESFFY